MQTSFYTNNELQELGFRSIGKKVFISRKASLYSIGCICIGDNVRIDDFCILSGDIEIGSNIHIGAYSALYGNMGIVLRDNTGISPRCSLYSAMDDFGGDFLIGPIHEEQFTNVTGNRIVLNEYSHCGANSVVFPGVTFGVGSVLGAMSLASRSLPEWTISVGIPARVIRERSQNLLYLK